MTEHAAHGCSGKRRYRDNIAAMFALSQIQWRGKDGHDEQRVYHCANCNGYHLTAMPLHDGRPA